MKLFQVLLLCVWLLGSSSALQKCACTRVPTMLRSSWMDPIGIIWPGTCFKLAFTYKSDSKWSALINEEDIVYALRTSLKITPCPDQMNARFAALCPRIISREEWGARKPKKTRPLKTPVKFAVVHHSETSQCTSETKCILRVRSIQNFHMDKRGWDDIGYNFLIGGDGNIYEGRGADIVGAHTKHYNRHSLGLCVIGNYMEVSPNAIALYALRRMMKCLTVMNKLRPTYTLKGHRDLGSTDCPGDRLYRIITGWPHYRESKEENTIF